MEVGLSMANGCSPTGLPWRLERQVVTAASNIEWSGLSPPRFGADVREVWPLLFLAFKTLAFGQAQGTSAPAYAAVKAPRKYAIETAVSSGVDGNLLDLAKRLQRVERTVTSSCDLGPNE